jgi:pSer/pThr/pTyr-binding forkhead associated (FHA) protein/ABC-type cobalamin/Fe3+-siderophores transport system ATPase subunit
MPDHRSRHALLRALHPGPLNPEQAVPASGCTIGRDARQSDLLVRRPDVSRCHARLECSRDGQWRISDLESTNGTQLNGRRIDAATTLEHGDVISLGRARVPDFEFIISEDLAAARRIKLAGTGPWTIGRDLEHPLSLPADSVVSLDHARLRALPDGLCIEDLGSRNGTWVNGRRVRRSRIDDDSRIVIGGSELRVQTASGGPVIAIHSLGQALGVTVEGLKTGRGDPPLSFEIEPGKLQLICLPDGEHRKRLIQTLVGVDRPSAGRLAFSEPAIDSQLERRRDRIGEVHPDCQPGPRQRLDHHLEDLACLALAKDVPGSHRRELIRTTLEALGLSAVAGRRWGRISPLERQLGRIAGALLHRPGLLLIDLPAQALDGPDQLRLLERLRTLAGTSLGIVVISDQPLDAAEDREMVELDKVATPPAADSAIRPQPHRASLARQGVLARRSLAGWFERPLALLEALALPLLLTAALWLALPERDSAKLGLIAVLISAALASAFQVSRWQAGLVYLTRRHLLLGDALVALSLSAMVVGLGQDGPAVLSLSMLDTTTGASMLPAALALVVPAATLGLACGLLAGARPLLAMGLVALAVSVQVLTAAVYQANDGSGLILTRLAELSPTHWADQLHQARSNGGNWLKPLAFLAGQALLFFGLARLVLRRRLF